MEHHQLFPKSLDSNMCKRKKTLDLKHITQPSLRKKSLINCLFEVKKSINDQILRNGLIEFLIFVCRFYNFVKEMLSSVRFGVDLRNSSWIFDFRFMG